MNIKEAKEQIKYAVTSYLAKDDYGEYMIPIEEQRPVFMTGAPGIGKTAIMRQISDELDIGLVAYSMTHHTRQSALGLPFINKKTYGGVEYSISEYTMSEIIASIYNIMEETGIKEGILFLDEINCVSETLAPSMLQFLQYKTFGGHRIPEGWIIVTAGNPPEYNRSVHPFDIVTMDRIKKIDVDPDYGVWKEYALSRAVHPAIISYLDIKKEHFYSVESTASGRIFVTARGWADLSAMVELFEAKDMPVNYGLISQYLQHPRIARDFAAYYDLFRKYRADYEIPSILAGTATASLKSRIGHAGMDEHIALISLLMESVGSRCEEVLVRQKTCLNIHDDLKAEKPDDGNAAPQLCDTLLTRREKELSLKRLSQSLSGREGKALRSTLRFYEDNKLKPYEEVLSSYRGLVSGLKEMTVSVQGEIEHCFEFLEDTDKKNNDVLLFVTELTQNSSTSEFISSFGSDAYFRHSKELMFHERNKELLDKLDRLED